MSKQYQNLLFYCQLAVKLVKIGRSREIGIAIEVVSSFLASTGSEWAKRKYKTVWINVSRLDVQFCTPHEWPQFTDLSDDDDEEEQTTKENTSVSQIMMKYRKKSNVIDRDWETLPARGVR